MKEKIKSIEEIAKEIEEKDGRLYLVGGAVRDTLLGREITDEDYCVTGLTQEEFQSLFPEAKIRGKDFAVFDMEGKEFALARKEVKTGKGHKEFEIQTDKKITIEEDLARRDITVNSMAQHVLTKQIIDPFGGKKDLKECCIRATTNAFKEDPLRVYRVARFASQLKFAVENNTIAMMKSLKEELYFLSPERVFTEFKKALLSEKPSIFFEVLRKAEVLDVHFKEIQDLIGKVQPEKYHPEGDSYVHTLQVLDNSVILTNKVSIRFSALVHDLGKGQTPLEMLPHHYGHEERGVKLVGDLANRLKLPNEWIACGKVSAKEHMRGGKFEDMKPSTKVSFIERVAKSKIGLDGLEIVVKCDKARQRDVTEMTEINFAEIGKECLKQINGKYIKEKYGNIQGIELGNKLHEERIEWMKEKTKPSRKTGK
ncbi:MAG: HD domain-containing protein [Clostridia bacterium]